MNHIHNAQKGILDRLMQCLLREKLIPYKEEEGAINIELSKDSSIRIGVKRKFYLNRIEISDVSYILSSGTTRIETPEQLIHLLQLYGLFPESEEAAVFSRELQNSTENYQLSLKEFSKRQKSWLPYMEQYDNPISWIHQLAVENETFSPLAFFEQLAIHGHTLHPCTKTKMGMSLEEAAVYSPECGGMPEIVYAAVHKSRTAASLLKGTEIKTLLFQQNDALEEAFRNELDSQSLDPEEYELLPLHPWQAEHVIPELYYGELQDRLVVLIEGIKEPAFALASLRTLLPAAQGRKNPYHLKTAIRVQATSAVRTVSPASASHGPKFTQLFQELANRPDFPETLILVKEEGGIHFKDQGSSDEREKNLAAMIRENPEVYTDSANGELAIPGVALISDSPFGNGSLLTEAVRLYKNSKDSGSLEVAAEDWIRDYSRLLFQSVLPVMTRYGIALEAHLQNSIPVLKHGAPVKLIVRDYGGIKLYNKRLQKTGLEFVFQMETHVEALNAEALQDTVSHAIIQNHLGELIITLVKELNIKEEKFWEIASEEMDLVWNSLYDDPDAPADRQAMMERELSLKSLVGMRLKHTIDNTYTKVPNPFAAVKEGGSKRAELQN
ncbi:IucA/IucC family protein [Metabacillus sp. FJAT-52054]|uniref:IucA/IucC family protein n=1 Tax=Metabacillus sediminis TaxID=3117746 RepID=A0ABZ2NLB0_9BACI